MVKELLLRFAFGGAIVCVFSIIGEAFKPKTFSGIFGAAPSVAIASLALAEAMHGRAYVATEGRSLLIGAAAFYVYGAACVAGTKREGFPVWASAGLAWSAWLVVALLLWKVGRDAGLLQ